ncbi:MAG TPA: hypothetical protein VLA77_02450 [Candidatus Saccharimonadales bacterium]|nr:hypothetical protein [Candidatus Saccharimonadales bacterium]
MSTSRHRKGIVVTRTPRTFPVPAADAFIGTVGTRANNVSIWEQVVANMLVIQQRARYMVTWTEEQGKNISMRWWIGDQEVCARAYKTVLHDRFCNYNDCPGCYIYWDLRLERFGPSGQIAAQSMPALLYGEWRQESWSEFLDRLNTQLDAATRANNGRR